MSNRLLKDISGVRVTGLIPLVGILKIASDASVSSSSFVGGTWTKTATGQYTLTLDDAYIGNVVSVTATIVAATAVDLKPQIKSYDAASAKTILVNLLAVATPTDPSAACELHLCAWMKNSTVSP